MALKCCRSETLALSPLISLLSFNLSATDTINLSASQPLLVLRRSCKAYNFKAWWVIDRSEEGTADKSDSLQRSSEVCFHHEGRQNFRRRHKSSEELTAWDFILNSVEGKVFIVSKSYEKTKTNQPTIKSTSVSLTVALDDTFLHHDDRGHCSFFCFMSALL